MWHVWAAFIQFSHAASRWAKKSIKYFNPMYKHAYFSINNMWEEKKKERAYKKKIKLQLVYHYHNNNNHLSPNTYKSAVLEVNSTEREKICKQPFLYDHLSLTSHTPSTISLSCERILFSLSSFSSIFPYELSFILQWEVTVSEEVCLWMV